MNNLRIYRRRLEAAFIIKKLHDIAFDQSYKAKIRTTSIYYAPTNLFLQLRHSSDEFSAYYCQIASSTVQNSKPVCWSRSLCNPQQARIYYAFDAFFSSLHSQHLRSCKMQTSILLKIDMWFFHLSTLVQTLFMG